jgi:hypothetical protein
MTRGLPMINHVDKFCDICVITKHRRAPFPAEAQYRTQEPLKLVHGDLCGPVTPATLGRVADATSCYSWTTPHSTCGWPCKPPRTPPQTP